MPVWSFQAVDAQGQTRQGRIEALTREAAASQLRLRSLTPLRLNETRTAPRANARRRHKAGAFVRNLSMLLQAGHNAEHALVSMSRHAGEKTTTAIASAVLDDLRGGASLSDAMQRQPDTFPAHFAVAAEAGQASGALGRALADLSADEERRSKLIADVRGALAYPAVLAVGMCGAIAFMIVFVLPRFAEMFENINAAPPQGLAELLAASRFLQGNWPWLIAGTVAVLATFAFAFRFTSVREKLDRILLQSYVLGPILTAALSARFFNILALLLRNGQSAAPALASARRTVENRWARAQLDQAFARVREGSSAAAEIAATGVLPPLAGDLLSALEDAGVLADGAARLALLYENELERRTQILVRVSEPLVLGISGLLIGSIIVSIVSALIGVNETLAR